MLASIPLPKVMGIVQSVCAWHARALPLPLLGPALEAPRHFFSAGEARGSCDQLVTGLTLPGALGHCCNSNGG